MPANASNPILSYKSSNENVVKVDDKGFLSAISVGNATVTISSTDGTNISKEIEVTVVKYVHNIVVSHSAIKLNVGESARIDAYALPADATITDIKFQSSDEDVAFINDKGVVMAMSEGTATITIMSCDKLGVSEECLVTVQEKSAIETVVTPGERVSIFSLDGAVVAKNIAYENRPKLTPGIYILLKSDGSTAKIIIKK